MSYRKVIEEEMDKVLDKNWSGCDISIVLHDDEIRLLCENIIKRLEAGDHLTRIRNRQ